MQLRCCSDADFLFVLVFGPDPPVTISEFQGFPSRERFSQHVSQPHHVFGSKLLLNRLLRIQPYLMRILCLLPADDSADGKPDYSDTGNQQQTKWGKNSFCDSRNIDLGE